MAKEKKEKKQLSKKKIVGIVLGVILVLVVAAAAGVYYIGHRYYARTNYLSDEDAAKQIEAYRKEQEENSTELTDEEKTDTQDDEEETLEEEEEELDPELQQALENMARYSSTEPITTDGDVYNVILAGLDTTTEGWIGNTDSMILISINYRLHRISMISLMRDTYVHIPGIGNRKLNAAYPNGGGPLMVETIEENYKIDVDRYVTVNFGSMIDIIDEIGEIEITFTEAEANNANKSIKQQCRILGLKSKKYLIPGEGTYMCNGMQAVAYARIRKVGNSDYQRTERQREVMMKLLENVKEMNLEDLDRIATRILPLLTHNVPESEFWGLLAKAPTLLNYNIIQDRIPYDGMYYSYNGNLVPDWEKTVRKLKETIYGEEAIDEEGNVLTVTNREDETEGVSESAETVTGTTDTTGSGYGSSDQQENQIGSDAGSRMEGTVIGIQEEDGPKAAVLADNIETDETEETEEDSELKLPALYYVEINGIETEEAPEVSQEHMLPGDVYWKKQQTVLFDLFHRDSEEESS